jgi:hypothetical protein
LGRKNLTFAVQGIQTAEGSGPGELEGGREQQGRAIRPRWTAEGEQSRGSARCARWVSGASERKKRVDCWACRDFAEGVFGKSPVRHFPRDGGSRTDLNHQSQTITSF